jgi:signal transduction histidine kinase
MAGRKPSLFLKLAFRLTGVTVFLVAVLLAILAWRLDSVLDGLLDSTLTRQADELARHIAADSAGYHVDLPDTLRLSYEHAAAGDRAIFAVIDANGQTIATSPGVTGPLADDLLDLAPGQEEFFASLRQEGRTRVSGVSVAYAIDGRTVIVQAAQSEDHGDVLFDTIAGEFASEHGWIVVLFVAILLGTTFATVRGTLRPVREASRMASRINPGELETRLPEGDMPREILPLIEAVNRAFNRLQKGIEVQRSFTADAAHQLRTPLAILNVQIDQIAEPALRARLKKDVGLLNRIVAQLLHAAQAETLVLPVDARIDLVEVAREVATYLAPIAVEAGVTIELLGGEEGPVPVYGHAEAMGHALRNLVENAIGHAPKGSAVEVVIERPSTVHVIDHGPGIPPEDRANVVRRFWRADQSTSGAGLGLAIVAQIAQAHGATLMVGEGPADRQGHHGAMFTMTLRPA